MNTPPELYTLEYFKRLLNNVFQEMDKLKEMRYTGEKMIYKYEVTKI